MTTDTMLHHANHSSISAADHGHRTIDRSHAVPETDSPDEIPVSPLTAIHGQREEGGLG